MMSVEFDSDDVPIPSVMDASRALAQIVPVAVRSRRLARDVSLGRPLLAWGVAWMVGAVLFAYVPTPFGGFFALCACVGATAVSWLARHREVRLGAERRFAVGWAVLFASSPFLVVVVAPPNGDVLAVFVGCLWAVGMLIYAVGTADVALGVIGAFILLLSACTRIVVPAEAMLTVGIAGGGAMAGLGVWRMRWRR